MHSKGVTSIDWGSGVWQRVLIVHYARKDFIHVNTTQEKLFPTVEEADRSIKIVRDAIMDIHARFGKSPPDCLQDDDDKGWDRGLETMAHGQAVHAGVDQK